MGVSFSQQRGRIVDYLGTHQHLRLISICQWMTVAAFAFVRANSDFTKA
jgi:hypothetical protein